MRTKYRVKSGDDLPETFGGWVWEDAKLIPRGELTMWIGHDGEGKTTVVLNRVAQWTREDEVVFLAMQEDSPEITKARLKAADADLDMCVVQPDRPDGFMDAAWAIPDDLEKMEAYWQETGTTVAVLDSLDSHMTSSPVSHRARLALASIRNAAQRCGVAVIFLHHFNKGGTKTSVDQAIGGGRGIKAAFRNILVWGAPFNGIEFEGDDEGPKPTHALAVHKDSYGPKWPERPTMVFSADTKPNPYWKDETVVEFELIDSTTMISPEDIYRARHQSQETVKDQYVSASGNASDAIIKLLYEYKGWMPATELEEKAIAAGASRRTVKGVRATMARHELIEKGKRGEKWYWRITPRGRQYAKTLQVGKPRGGQTVAQLHNCTDELPIKAGVVE